MAQAKTYENIGGQFSTDEPFIDVDKAAKDLQTAVERLKPFIKDSVNLIADYYRRGTNILYEGAQGTLLDIDHGTYPFVTSSSTTIGGAFTGGGVFLEFDKRIAVVKSYTTRVGEGPFPTEQENEIGELLRKNGNEFGATTGRPRRCGWLDIKLLQRSFTINGFNYISLSKLSCLSGFDKIKVAVDYDDEFRPVYREFPGWDEKIEGITDIEKLPLNCRKYIDFIEESLQVQIGMISTGPKRNHIIHKERLI